MNPLENLLTQSVEIIGWVATLFILLSFLYDGNKLRYINIVGASLWFVYGLIELSYSIMFLNLCVVLIHIYKLLKPKNKEEKNGI